MFVASSAYAERLFTKRSLHTTVPSLLHVPRSQPERTLLTGEDRRTGVSRRHH